MNKRTSSFRPIPPVVALICALVVGCATQTPAAAETPAKKQQMKMVIRVALSVKPEQTSALIDYMAKESKIVREMQGCERYELFQSPTDETRFMLYEEWATGDAFKAYQGSDVLKKSFAVLGPMLAGPPDSAYYEGTLVGPKPR